MWVIAIDRVCSVKIAGYWSSSFLRVYGSRRSRGLWLAKKTRPIFSHLDRTDLVNIQQQRPKRVAWVLPRPQYWFEFLFHSNALNMWWKKNFRVSRETFNFICATVGPRPVLLQRIRSVSSLRVAVPTPWGKTGGRERLRSLHPVFPRGVGTATRRLICFWNEICLQLDISLKEQTKPELNQKKNEEFRSDLYSHDFSKSRHRQNLQQKSRSQAVPKLVSQHDNSGSVTSVIADERTLVGYSGTWFFPFSALG